MKPRDFAAKFFVKRANYDRQRQIQETSLDFLRHLTNSKAEYFQDLWVLSETNYKIDGFFVEFGATNGIDASNTWLLENNYKWRGLVIEPNPVYKEALSRNRNCMIDFRAIWDESGKQIEFIAMNEPYLSVAKEDLRAKTFVEDPNPKVLSLNTISLTDILLEYNAPRFIDFMSVDVEGSEERILKPFFKSGKFEVNLMVVEHNWRDEQASLLSLVMANGYERVFAEHSSRDYWFKKIRS
jgi:FkbM family methyltransferase